MLSDTIMNKNTKTTQNCTMALSMRKWATLVTRSPPRTSTRLSGKKAQTSTFPAYTNSSPQKPVLTPSPARDLPKTSKKRALSTLRPILSQTISDGNHRLLVNCYQPLNLRTKNTIMKHKCSKLEKPLRLLTILKSWSSMDHSALKPH